jgi:hypothetical protein
LEGALTDDIIDVAWTQITVNNARELQIDFTCPTFLRIVLRQGRCRVDATAADSPVYHWRAIFYLTVPAPFELVDVGLSGPDYDVCMMPRASTITMWERS